MIINTEKFPKIKISAFTPFRNKDGQIVPGVQARTTYLYEELTRFKEGYYSMVIDRLRELTSKDERSKYKLENLTAFTFGCSFKPNDYRKQINIDEQTNIVYIDIDQLGANKYISEKKIDNPYYGIKDLRDELFLDLPCLFAGLSCSGTGVFLLIRCNDTERADAFEDIKDYIFEKYRVEVDVACKDIARLTFATYDNTCHIRPWPETSTWDLRKDYVEKKTKIAELRKNERNKIVAQHTSDVPSLIMSRAVNMIRYAREGERHNKIRNASRLLGGYIATNVLDEEYCYNALMAAAADINYDDMRDAEKAINFGIRAGKDNPIELNIITPEDPNWNFFIEQDEQRQRDIKNLYSEIHDCIRAGTPMNQIDYVELAGRYYVDVERIKVIAENLYSKFHYEFGVNNKPQIDKVEAYLTGKYEFRRDVITGDLQGRVKGMQEWRVIKYENIWRDLQKARYRFKFDDMVRLLNTEYVPMVNVWHEFFHNIKIKDSSFDAIDHLATYIKCKDPEEQYYFQHMFKKMLVRTVRCALDDNYANRTVFVLASSTQSNGKSTFIRWLNPFGSHQYFAENPLEDNKDSRIRLSETFIYNLEELATITKFEINRLKAIISQVGTRDRKPYGRQAENIVRRCSFFGSTNLGSFLTDDSNTRWLCFEISSIDWEYSKQCDKLQIWGQAYQLYKEGYNCELTNDEANQRDIKNTQFQVQTVEGDLISKFFRPGNKSESNAIFMTSTSIHEKLLILTKESRVPISNVWVGRSLSRLGYIKSRHNNIYGYWVIPLNQNPYEHYKSDGEVEEIIEIPF